MSSKARSSRGGVSRVQAGFVATQGALQSRPKSLNLRLNRAVLLPETPDGLQRTLTWVYFPPVLPEGGGFAAAVRAVRWLRAGGAGGNYFCVAGFCGSGTADEW